MVVGTRNTSSSTAPNLVFQPLITRAEPTAIRAIAATSSSGASGSPLAAMAPATPAKPVSLPITAGSLALARGLQ